MGIALLVFAVVVVALAVAVGRRDRERRRAAATTVRLAVDDVGIERDLADGRHEEVAWSEVDEVRYVLLPRGPWDVRGRLIVAGPGERGCIVPIDVAEEHGLVAALGRLPGFDIAQLADVLERERAGTTILWTRPART